ncbi:conserved Plasmodium protein, unknown function [Plasmodium ovale wallikeri]|uniref:Mini-chromosome maintenance complex-binding protein n=1 Tax=Plasmodium ovale wallikeri TaxID=864142 RepID=A0A1A8ZRW3_PLAOA|nr:conserved Plasmodium protein, unknown function [Plasmodium ovale wallikeri]SBT46622.1 conserved Plasmodium protein, unknown function [Plasmodium ovale wallikeri]
MNVLKQIDECFANYTEIYGSEDVDSYWDEGIVVNKYIQLGNGKKKLRTNDSANGKKETTCNQATELSSVEKLESHTGKNDTKMKVMHGMPVKQVGDGVSNMSESNLECEQPNVSVKKKKDNLFVCNDLVEKCLCINTLEDFNKLEDATLVRWTCMVQQIISPESYIGVYKLKNKTNGGVMLKSSKYKDYIDTDDNWEIMEDCEKKHKGEYYEVNFEKYCKKKEVDTEMSTETICGDRDNKMEDEKDTKIIYTNNDNNNDNDKKEDSLKEDYEDMFFYENRSNFKKYWKRYLFLCTNIPGIKGSWCKELYDYSSHHNNGEMFLKNISDFENISNASNCNECSSSMRISHAVDNDAQNRESRSSSCSSSSSSRGSGKRGTCVSSEVGRDVLGDVPSAVSCDNLNNCEEGDTHHSSKKARCIIKIYDDDSQYNGKNAKDFLKLNDIIEVIGIYRKHQIKDYEEYQKNFNFYFYYDQNFLKYSCIHVFQYTKINYFNPLNNCILFPNDLANILENGPFQSVTELRKHLLIYISSAFSNDLLVANYFFFYLCGSYIKESKFKLGKISLSIFNLLTDTNEEKENNPLGSKNESSLNEEKKEKTKCKLNYEPEETHRKGENFQSEEKELKKSFPKNSKKINKMCKNLIPLCRYIPLFLKSLSSEYLVSVMNHQNGELKKGKLQLANNTYVLFDECVLDVGKLNTISLKNFHCIESLITSQEIPFIFNTDITFETQNNILILSKKKSMFINYIDISIPIRYHKMRNIFKKNTHLRNMKSEIGHNNLCQVHGEKEKEEKNDVYGNTKNEEKIFSYDNPSNNIFSNDFINTYENYNPNKNELMQFRRYINYILSKNNSAKIHADVSDYITDTFVSLRQKNKDINQFVLNSWICMSRILAFSDGYNEISKDHWNYIMKLENERRLRLNHLDKIYI